MLGNKWRNKPTALSVAPTGEVRFLSTDDIKPSADNPRKLFDPGPLKELEESIRMHGVLVPLTVYKVPAQSLYRIIDGERRFKCCVELRQEGILIEIPVNVVHAPDKLEQMIYMFNIHSFREQWELMPTALGLKEIINQLPKSNNKESVEVDELHQITGLSKPQITRCLKILKFPDKYQRLSMEIDVSKRIPSNFWIEVLPVLDFARQELPDLFIEDKGEDIKVLDLLVDKYWNKKIKSVIHFRRIMEAIEVTEEDVNAKISVINKLKEFILEPLIETRQAFDQYITDQRRIQNKTIEACESFIRQITNDKIGYSIDGRKELISKLEQTIGCINDLIEKLSGDDPNSEEQS